MPSRIFARLRAEYPLSLGATVRIRSAANSSADIADTLSREDGACATALARTARHYASDTPAAAVRLDQLSARPGAAIAAAIAGPRMTAPAGIVVANHGAFSH